MKIRGQDIEIKAGSGESLTYRRFDRSYNNDGILSPKVRGYFIDGEDLIILKVYASNDDNTPIIEIEADIIDGDACIDLSSVYTSVIEPITYQYDVFWTHLFNEPVCLVGPANLEIIFTSETNLGS